MTAITNVVPSEVFNRFRINPEGTTELLREILLERYAQAMVGTPDMIDTSGKVHTLDDEDGRNHAISMMDVSVVPSMPDYRIDGKNGQMEIYLPLGAFNALIGENYILTQALFQKLLVQLRGFGSFNAKDFKLIGDGANNFTPTGLSTSDYRLHIYPVISDKGGGFMHVPDESLVEPMTDGVVKWLQKDMEKTGILMEGIATNHSGHIRLSPRYYNLVVASGYDKPHRIDRKGPFQEHIGTQVKGAVEDLLRLSGVQGVDTSVWFETDFQARDRYHFVP